MSEEKGEAVSQAGDGGGKSGAMVVAKKGRGMRLKAQLRELLVVNTTTKYIGA